MITAFVLAFATLQASDTTITVSKGQRLDAEIFAGSVTVKTWSRDAVQVTGDVGRKGRLEVESRGNTLSIETTGKYGPAGAADLVITVPAWMPVSVDGVYTDVTVDGCKCPVEVETVQGTVIVKGAEGVVSLQSVEGAVEVSGVTGNVSANSVNEGVTVRDVTGNVRVEAVNGDVELRNIRSGDVDASTVNGDVTFDGEIRGGGRYAFTSHQGDVTVTVPANASATIRVNTFNGEFESDFPVTLSGQAMRKKLTFTIGGGSATVDLESFSGDIQLLRPGSRPGR
ncbi:MAG TPA: DUF4097 family beta strand repeat-containing protein [Gemmatimonadales bacterium]|nr:DUF4097 family beta strand repeat-containing protein [Gemmatimonadales bacterium]